MADRNPIFDAIVVGGGPAGFAAALSLANSGKHVVILEAMPSPGRKLILSGGGKCNFTNTLPPQDFAASFGKAQERFVRPALLNFPPHKLREFFQNIGCPSNADDGFHYFPSGKNAVDVLNSLISICRQKQIEIITSTPVASIVVQNGIVKGVKTSDGNQINSSVIVLATGGKSYPQTGSNGSGFELAKCAGHTITPLFPALTGINLAETFPATISGISLPDVTISIPSGGKDAISRGNLLFTHTGISGTAAMNISALVAEMLAKNSPVNINLNLSAGETTEIWLTRFNLWQKENGKPTIKKLLSRHFPERVASILLSEKNFTAANFPAEERRILARNLVAMPLSAISTGSFDHAIVTHGGVCRNEVNPKTMESEILPGLFFAGEILDIDGPCGGFNIQWAFSSGFQVKP